ncbi:MAG: uracil-DNA glycosylase family protein [Candidatus Limimorpha sp.]
MIEKHPLHPFLPTNAKVLFLGSFPPPANKWCMDFYYPNFINDHWRIEGEIWFNDKNYFVDTPNKRFKKDEIIRFLNEKGIAFYDTAKSVIRLKNNASDAFLNIVETTDINNLLSYLPECKTIATTGELATKQACSYFASDVIPRPNNSVTLDNGIRLYRLPSSSRAYPLAFDKKVEAYRKMFDNVFNLTH